VPLLRKIYGNSLRIRILICLDEKARFLDEIADFIETNEYDTHQNLKVLEEAGVVQCVDEIYSLTRNLGVPSAKLLRDFQTIRK
jgi:predicted transcriptional regulator